MSKVQIVLQSIRSWVQINSNARQCKNLRKAPLKLTGQGFEVYDDRPLRWVLQKY